MAISSTPHFHNDPGVATIRTGSREFMCIGALPPFDHPHVFIDMGTETDVICSYCGTRFLHDTTLAEGVAEPSACVWNDHDQAA